MRHLSLTEYVRAEGVALALSEVDALRELVPSVKVEPSRSMQGRYDLTPGSWIGAIALEDLAVEIRPKIPVESVLFMISYSLDPSNWRSENFDHTSTDYLLEAVIPGFVAQIRRAFRRGILQGYREEEAALLTVRGRIRFDDQIRDRFGVFPPIEVRYDEFTEDIEVNRLIKAALARLEKLSFRSDKSAAQLRAFRGSLERVELCEYSPGSLPEIHYDRLNEHYRPAVELAKLILRSTSFDLGEGKVRSSCFLVNMNEVFENFVVVALREALGLSPGAFPQGNHGRRLFLDSRRKIRLEPDFSWWEMGECTFVGDVKYKRVNVPGVKHPDLYQLLAYLTAAEIPEGLLVYAAGEGENAIHSVPGAGTRLHVRPLELSQDPEQLLGQIGELANVIKRIRGGNREKDLIS